MVFKLVSIYSIALNLACNKNKMYKTLDNWSRDTLNFDFLEKGLEIVYPPLSWHILLIDQILLPDCLYFLKWGQYLYFICLFPRLWRYKFWN